MKKTRQLQRADKMWIGAVGLLILLQFWWLPGDSGSPHDTYSAGIEGKRGLFQTLERLSDGGLLPTVRRVGDQLIPKDAGILVIAGPERYPDEYEQRSLREFVAAGGALVFAPSWSNPEISIPGLGITLTRKFGWYNEVSVTTATPQTPTDASTDVDKPAEDGDPSASSADKTAQDNSAADVDRSSEKSSDKSSTASENTDSQTADNDTTGDSKANGAATADNTQELDDLWTLGAQSELVSGPVTWRTRAEISPPTYSYRSLVTSDKGGLQAAVCNVGIGKVVIVASSDIFSNRSMLDENSAELAVRLIEVACSRPSSRPANRQTLIVSEFLNVSEAWRGTAVLLSPSLRTGTLQLLLVAVLAGWFGFHRFGPARRSHIVHRRSLTESAAAVGNLHFRTNSGPEVISNYIEYVRTQMQKLFGPGLKLEDANGIALRTGMEADEVRRRVSSAMELANSPSTSATNAASAIRGLSEILNQLSGHRKQSGQK